MLKSEKNTTYGEHWRNADIFGNGGTAATAELFIGITAVTAHHSRASISRILALGRRWILKFLP
jgi:hypothetical protein